VRQLPAAQMREALQWLLFASTFWGGWLPVRLGDKQLTAARAFRPLPGLVLAEGSTARRWLFWPLDNPVPWADLKAANRRIAYALRSTQKHGDPDAAWFPAPGTCLRAGRARPVPVRVSRLEPVSYRVDAVAGALKEPPAIEWWKTA
jgi:hypothetical protein